MTTGNTIKAFLCATAAVATALSVGAFAGAMPQNATLIPAPREIRATGGEYLEKKPPKLEKVAGLPPEGYELSITTNGITIRHSDDAGAFYARITRVDAPRTGGTRSCAVPVRTATLTRGRVSRKIRIITSGVPSRHSKRSISSIHTRAWSLRRGRTSWADSAATGPRTPSVSRVWNGKCGRADLRLLKYSGHILILPSATSRSSRSVRRTIAAASSVHTSTVPR